jgi:small basic protein (TIGR04137 family)
MSIHSSLRGVNTLEGDRSVFSRVERLQILIKQGKFKKEDGSVYGLPKVRTRFKTAGVKKVKAAAAAPAPGATAAAPAAPAAGGKKPAAAAAPAKPAAAAKPAKK